MIDHIGSPVSDYARSMRFIWRRWRRSTTASWWKSPRKNMLDPDGHNIEAVCHAPA